MMIAEIFAMKQTISRREIGGNKRALKVKS